MVMYGIEVFKKNKKPKQVIILVVITIVLIGLAVFGGIKLAEHKHLANNNPIDFTQENDKNNKPSSGNNENNNAQNGENNQAIGNNEKHQATGNNNPNNENNQTTGNNSQNNASNPAIENNNQNNENNNEEIGQNNEVDIGSIQNENEPTKNGAIQKLTNEQINSINNIYSSNTKRVFLTFDDGPSSAVTPNILDTLKNENIKATFFVLGTMVKSNPELVKREYEEGHYIANHGYSHVYKKVYENENKPLEEYRKTNELIQKAINDSNYQSNVFRFPGGSNGGYYDDIKSKAKKVLKKNGIAYLDWNALTNDSAGATTEEEMLKNLKSTSKNKNSIVILMHDAPNKKQTAKTLPKIIKYFRDNGYAFKSLYDIL